MESKTKTYRLAPNLNVLNASDPLYPFLPLPPLRTITVTGSKKTIEVVWRFIEQRREGANKAPRFMFLSPYRYLQVATFLDYDPEFTDLPLRLGFWTILASDGDIFPMTFDEVVAHVYEHRNDCDLTTE